MPELYRIFGSELSPYSVKVRSYARYKGIAHDWIVRNPAVEAEFQRHAKLPLVPLVVTPTGSGWQDSTPIIEQLEQLYAEPSIHPAEPGPAFLSALIEEYGDEWVNKSMFHYRWTYEPDQQSTAARLARSLNPDLSGDLGQAIAAVKARMIPRLKLVGSSAATKDHLEGSYRRLLAILEAHLNGRMYLFGARPAFADFSLFAQLHQLSTDPTPGAIMRAEAPHVARWIQAMLSPRAEGPFEPWAALAPTLLPLLREEIGGLFLPWSAANARAVAEGAAELTVALGGRPFVQEPQRYAAKSFGVLRARYTAVADRSGLDPILCETGCWSWLQ
ncbi:MAG: glutathione S-transferase family protein [Candidatus Binatia bacterium]